MIALFLVNGALANTTNTGTDKPKTEVEKDSEAGKKSDVIDPKEKTDSKEKEPAKKAETYRPDHLEYQDSTSNSLNKYNFLFYFIYKYKYESQGESLKKWFE